VLAKRAEGGPLVVVAKIDNALRLTAVDGRAAGMNLAVGMPLADARAMIPSLIVAEADDVRLFRHEENLFMRAPAGTTVAHPQHDVLQIPPGEYVIGVVRVYDHFGEEADDQVD